ncbi:MAG: LacI family DNA-binding transcriptional regulator [Lentisphaerota bacterium]
MVTMKDIANAAGVSRPTVSQVLSGQRAGGVQISTETRKRVLETAERLGYRRNEIARSIKTGKTNVIGIIGGLQGGYSLDIITGIAEACAASGYFMKLLPVNNLENDTDALGQAARQCVEHRVAGVICRSLKEHALDTLRAELDAMHIPIVLVDSSSHHDWCSRVVSDDFAGIKEGVEFLLKQGHRKIVQVTSPLNLEYARIRADGYLAAMRESGLPVSEDMICEIDTMLELSDNDKHKLAGFLKTNKPAAVICGSDPVAMKVLMLCHEMKIAVPDDMSVIGFAGLDYTIFSSPPLTTIKQPFCEMGEKAFELLLRHINGDQKIYDLKLKTSLVIRDSTWKAKGKM